MKLISTLIAAPLLLCLGLPAAADPRDGMYREGGHERFEGRAHFDEHHWREGRWRHGWHDGRIGWWWVAGGLWYFYPTPVYPYPDAYPNEVTVVVQQPAQQAAMPPAPQAPPLQEPAYSAPAATPNTWYYCEPAKAYYPYVQTCPSAWKAVPASPPPGPH